MYYFIVNTQARTGNAIHVWREVKNVLKKENIPYKAYETSFEGHATEIARELSDSKNISDKVKIVILGGDGTINEVINGIADFEKVQLAVIPTGTGNDFARNMGIKGTTEEIIQGIIHNKQGTKLDLGIVRWDKERKSRIFAISSGVGFDAQVCKKTSTSRIKRIFNALHCGKLAYLIITIQTIFSLKTFDANILYGDRESIAYKKVIFTAAMNLRAEGGGVPMIPWSDPEDGILPLCVAANIPGVILPFYLIALVLGKHGKLKCFHVSDANKYYIHTNVPVVLHADGEYLADVCDVWYECLPDRLEILNTLKTR